MGSCIMTITKENIEKIIGGSIFRNPRVSCATCSLSELCLPRGLKKESLDKLDFIIKNSPPIAKGNHLYLPGDDFKSLFAIRTGSVKVYVLDKNGEEQIIGFYFPGEVIGFDAINKEKYICYAIALETLSYCKLPFEKMSLICAEIPEFQDQMFRLLSDEISNEHEMLLTLSKRTADEKLAIFIINLSNRFAKLGYSSTVFNLPMSRQEIGNYLGLAVETVSRVFTKFKRTELLDVDKKILSIKDKDALYALCGYNK